MDMAMDVRSQEAADKLLEGLTKVYAARSGKSLDEACEEIRRDLAYRAGYDGFETRLRVERLFRACHPYLGPAMNGQPSPTDAFRMGEIFGRNMGTKTYLANINEPLIEVRHADLTRWSEDSEFKSCCPKCEDGILFVYRDKATFKLARLDRCVVCAQQFRYTDDKIAGEEFAE